MNESKPGGYGRYKDDPDQVDCPRARSDMTPCIARDGHLALADDNACVGCGQRANGLDGLLQALRHEVTGKSPAPVTIPRHAADKLRDLVRSVSAEGSTVNESSGDVPPQVAEQLRKLAADIAKVWEVSTAEALDMLRKSLDQDLRELPTIGEALADTRPPPLDTRPHDGNTI